MKIRSAFYSILICVAFIGFQSCSDDDSDEPENVAGCNNFEAEYSDVADALSAYAENPSTATCEDYKAALIEFYDDFNDCEFWGDYYQEAYDQIQAMDCSEQGTT